MIIESNDIIINKKSKIFEIMEIARYLTDSQVKDPKYVCATCLSRMSKERGVYFDRVDFSENNTKLVVFTENTTTLDGYFFQFLNKYKAE